MGTVKDRGERRTGRVRRNVRRAAGGRARLSIFRSSQHIYAQVIDDEKGETLAAASSVEKETRASLKTGADVGAAKAVGKLVAERALGKGITNVIFDRGGLRGYRSDKAPLEAARPARLKICLQRPG